MYDQIRTNRRVRRGEIGVFAQTITPAIAAALKLPRDWGVVLGDVYPNSPAAKAGLRINDVILSLDGKPMENGRQFDVNVYRRPIGGSVNLEVGRGLQRTIIRVPVVERRDEEDRFRDLVTPEQNLIPRLGILGLDLTPELARGLPGLRSPHGVIVAVVASADGDGSGLLPGDVIHGVNGSSVRTLSDLRGRRGSDCRRFGGSASGRKTRAAAVRYRNSRVAARSFSCSLLLGSRSSIDRQPARYPHRHDTDQIAGARIGERLHELGDFVDDLIREDHAIEQDVSGGQDVGGVRDDGPLQQCLELVVVERRQLQVRLAVVGHEFPKREECSVVAIGSGELDVPEWRSAEGIPVRRVAGYPHATEVVFADLDHRPDRVRTEPPQRCGNWLSVSAPPLWHTEHRALMKFLAPWS